MDRPLKERLVGATVLVVVMIVVVPLFLDGPAHNRGAPASTVSEGVNLAPAEKRPHVIQLDAQSPTVPARRAAPAAGTRDELPAATAPVDKPTSASRPQASAGESSAPTPAPVASAPPKPVRTPPTVSQPDAGWAVQVGSFSSEKNARGLAEDLRARQYSAFHVRKNIDGRILYRVLIGPEQDRERADAMALRLKADGLPTTIVRHP